MAEQMKKVQKKKTALGQSYFAKLGGNILRATMAATLRRKRSSRQSVKAAPKLAGANSGHSRSSFLTWTLNLAKRAEKQLAKALARSRRLLLAALGEMQENPFSGDIRRLTSERSTWRRRVGDYRIFFDVHPDQHHIDVLEIARRTTTTYR